nr:AMP-binding protein [Streptomyces alkaliphilus]
MIAFAYSGQGSHFAGMGREIVRRSEAFAGWLAETVPVAERHGIDLEDALLSGSADLTDTTAAPAVFTFQVGLARALAEYGVEPDIVCGHSTGDFAAAVSAGVFDALDALELVIARAELMQNVTPVEAMAALFTSVDRAEELIAGRALRIATVNGVAETVVSGPAGAVEELALVAERARVPLSRLPDPRAGRNPATSSVTDDFRRHVERFPSAAARRRFIRVRPDGRVDDAALVPVDHWVEQLTTTIRYPDTMRAVVSRGDVAVVEISPGPVLTEFSVEAGARFATCAHSGTAGPAVALTAAALWQHGFHAPLPAPRGGRRLHLALPSPAVRRDRDPAPAAVPATAPAAKPAAQEAAALRTPAEIIRHAWHTTIGSPPFPEVGYLEAGGDSLGAIRFCEVVADFAPAGVSLQSLLGNAGYPELVEELTEALRDGRGRSPGAAAGDRPPTGGTAGYVPTPIQTRMLTAAEMGSAENVTVHVEFRGTVDIEAVRAAFLDLQAAVAVLRSRFTYTEDGWCASVSTTPAALEVVPVLGPAVREAVDGALAEAAAPITSESASAVRAWLIAVPGGVGHLVLAMHHAVGDATTVALVLSRLDAAYTARVKGVGPNLEPDDTFVELASRGELAGREHPAGDLDHWRERLRAQEDRSYSFIRPARAGGGVRTATAVLDPGATAALRSAAARSGATTVAWVLTALAQTFDIFDHDVGDLSIGLPVNIRHGMGLGDVCGPLINVVPLSWPEVVGTPFAEILRRSRSELADAMRLGHIDLGEVAEGRSRLPDPTVIFNSSQALRADAYTSFAAVPLPSSHAKYAMSWWLEDGDTATIGVEYDPGRIDEAVVESMLDVVTTIVTRAQLRPDLDGRGLWHLDRTPSQGVTGGPAVPYRSLSRTLENALAADPGRVVARCEGSELTAGELLARAGRIADALAARGIGRGSLVVLALPSTTVFLECLVATVFTGATYLPVDVSSPGAAHRQTLDRYRPDLIVDPDEAARLLESGDERAFRPGHGDTAGDLAYVILTSGSTGTPKGVAVSRGSLWNYLARALAEYDAADADFTLVSAPAVDLSVTSLFLPLLGTGSLWIPGHRFDGSTIVRAAREQPDDRGWLKATPTHLELLLGATEEPPPWRFYIIGGEQLTGALLADILRRRPDAVVVNEYGPTEATVGCVTYRAAPTDTVDNAVPIGTPIPGCTVTVIDGEGREVPYGAVGELLISGDVLAASYYGDEALTAASFPRGPSGSGRAYRSGDRVRWESRGLVYLGRDRAGRQVKLRGHRVDLDAIEYELRRVPGIAAARVLPDVDGCGTVTALTAYLVGRPPPGLRQLLGSRLRDVEIPATLTRVDSLPMLPSGKLAAARPEQHHDRATEPPAGPSAGADGGARRHIRDTMAHLLGRPVDDDSTPFADLGAHSMIILDALVILRRSHPHLHIQDFFDHPSVAALAAKLDGDTSTDARTRDTDPGRAAHPARSATVPARSGSVPVNRCQTADLVVTGANGLLGSALITASLAAGRSVIAVARRTEEAAAVERVHEALTAMGASADHSRLTVVDATHHPVPGTVDLRGCGRVIHSAGDIRHFGSHENFERSNVIPARAWASAAAEANCPFLLMSSSGLEGWDTADTDPANPYLRSKLRSERELRGVPGLHYAIVRLGSLVGRSDTGVFTQDPMRNRLYRILHAVLTARLAPVDIPWGIDISPVDLAAEAVLSLDVRSLARGTVVHIENGHPVGLAELGRMLRALGYSVDDGTREEMLTQVLAGPADRNAAEAAVTIETWLENTANALPLPVSDGGSRVVRKPLPPPDAALLRRLMRAVGREMFPEPTEPTDQWPEPDGERHERAAE